MIIDPGGRPVVVGAGAVVAPPGGQAVFRLTTTGEVGTTIVTFEAVGVDGSVFYTDTVTIEVAAPDDRGFGVSLNAPEPTEPARQPQPTTDVVTAGDSRPPASVEELFGVSRTAAAGAPGIGSRRRPDRSPAVLRREFTGLVAQRMPGKDQPRERERAIRARRARLVAWVRHLSEPEAKIVAVAILPGGELHALLESQVSGVLRRDVLAELATETPITQLTGSGDGRVSRPTNAAEDDSIAVEEATGEEDDYVAAGNLAVQVSPTDYRLWGFVTDHAQPRAEFTAALDEVGEILDSDQYSYVYITGHTSSTGPEAHNDALAEERARAIMLRLEDRGISRLRMFVKGEGSRSPLVPEDGNPSAMARNRRVDLQVVLVLGGQTKKNKRAKEKQNKRVIPCDAARYNVRFYTALSQAWSRSQAMGFRDVGGDPRSAKPDRTEWIVAAGTNGFSTGDALKMYECLPSLGYPPPPSPTTYGDWAAAVRGNQEMLDNGMCDPFGDFTPACFLPSPDQHEFPEPGDVAERGQRY